VEVWARDVEGWYEQMGLLQLLSEPKRLGDRLVVRVDWEMGVDPSRRREV
jgi:hypothetical protein